MTSNDPEAILTGMEPAHRVRASEAEYLERERQSETKHEYIDGEIVDMAGASILHNLLVLNVGAALRERLRGKPCVVLASDQRVNIRATRLYTYPDVSVVCGRPETHPADAQTLLNPLVIIEVLSDSTEAYDRGEKFAHYRGLPSLREYVLVSQRARRIEHYRRVEVGQWLLTEYQEGAAVPLPALGIELPLAEVYDKAELVAAEDVVG